MTSGRGMRGMTRAGLTVKRALTEEEKCRLFLGRFLFAAVTEGCNRARERFALGDVEISLALFAMAGEALATHTAQAFDQATPRARRVVRGAVKDHVMAGYDHAIQLIVKTEVKP